MVDPCAVVALITRRQNRLHRLVMGNSPARVVRKIRVPVLFVRPLEQEPSRSQPDEEAEIPLWSGRCRDQHRCSSHWGPVIASSSSPPQLVESPNGVGVTHCCSAFLPATCGTFRYIERGQAIGSAWKSGRSAALLFCCACTNRSVSEQAETREATSIRPNTACRA